MFNIALHINRRCDFFVVRKPNSLHLCIGYVAVTIKIGEANLWTIDDAQRFLKEVEDIGAELRAEFGARS